MRRRTRPPLLCLVEAAPPYPGICSAGLVFLAASQTSACAAIYSRARSIASNSYRAPHINSNSHACAHIYADVNVNGNANTDANRYANADPNSNGRANRHTLTFSGRDHATAQTADRYTNGDGHQHSHPHAHDGLSRPGAALTGR